jgi:4-amino-4-deoxy-L-arabinose transferase-like glycosyltransferase
MTAALAIGGTLLLVMIGVSWYGWVTLPADARVPVHFGVGYNNFVPKRLGLVMHPAAGAVVLVLSAVTTHGSHKSAPVFIFPLVMCLLVVVQVGAIKVARGRSGAAAS